MIRKVRIIMGMPIIIELDDDASTVVDLESAFAYFTAVDNRFSTYKTESEISAINRGELALDRASEDMKTIFRLAEETKQFTHGYFDIKRPRDVKDAEFYDPSGIVKGWAIFEVAELLTKRGLRNFYVDAGGDIEVRGLKQGRAWRAGIENPFNPRQVIKRLAISNCGVATSGTYARGEHIYNPQTGQKVATDLVSLTVIGPNIYEADRFATGAFAMGTRGLEFIESFHGLEGYAIDKNGTATMTTNFQKYTI